MSLSPGLIVNVILEILLHSICFTYKVTSSLNNNSKIIHL